MKRLLWKEFNERRWWVLVWGLAILGVSLFGKGQAFYGERGMAFSPFLPLPLVIGLLIGAGSYAGELARSQSVFSRPITPRALLVAKLLFAGIVCLGAPLLAGVIAWLTVSDTMRHLMSPWTLLSGALGVAWLYGLCYLFGLTCSVVIPGYAGGILTLAVVCLPLIAVLGGSGLLEGMGSFGYGQDGTLQSLNYYSDNAGWIFGCWLGVTCAGLSISRFALVLSKEERVKRFTFVFVPLFLASGVIGVLLPVEVGARLFMHWEVAYAGVSPTGKYALVSEERQPYTFGFIGAPGEYYGAFGDERYLVRMRDRRRIQELPNELNYWGWIWVTDEIAYAYDWGKDTLLLAYPSRGTTKQLTIGRVRPHYTSPDGRLLLLSGQRSKKATAYQLVDGRPKKIETTVPIYIVKVVDLDSGRFILNKEMEALENHGLSVYWQDNDTLAYRRTDDRTEYLRVNRS